MTKKQITVVAKSEADQQEIQQAIERHDWRPLQEDWEPLEEGRAFPRKITIEFDNDADWAFAHAALSHFLP